MSDSMCNFRYIPSEAGMSGCWNKAALAACHSLGSEGQKSAYMKWMYAGTKSECLQFCEGTIV